MGEASTKKRKRDGEALGKPKKKVVLDAPPPVATVSSILRPKHCPPVIANTPGIELPESLLFHTYQSFAEPRAKSKSSKQADAQNLLLHSTSHKSLDYTAREETFRGSQPLLNHYVGIYDSKTGRLEVIEAKKMVVRGQVRARQDAEAAAQEQETKLRTVLERKTELGQTFGTKKAKKVIREKVLNAIAPVRKPGDESPTKIDNASRAMLKTVGEVTSQMATLEDMQAVVDGAKPIPRANLETANVEEVYDPEVIIGADILNLVPIREWQEKAQHGESIQTASRFVAAHFTDVATDVDNLTRLRVLRYLDFVLLFYLHAAKNKGRLPQREKLRELLAPAPEAVIENIRRKFSDGGSMRKLHLDSLKTHCCAFALIVENYEMNTGLLRQDLRLEDREMNQYFHEVGARVKKTSTKTEGQGGFLAKLVIPLEFPKQRRIVPRR
ncbi:hypothetical protein HIM_07789 [Hirsutella minnesotensis 3608]|uniref:DNA-directed RNA polymerase I subunit rpa49 n=1 Tax=Hirsutella minnesotensis 3608 TaxID=1043627 RepID=A0A0F7ZMZ2_9HYPO|nr:hypothetical protein HIM_07789 [Hirsutella minnesotensis 3608]